MWNATSGPQMITCISGGYNIYCARCSSTTAGNGMSCDCMSCRAKGRQNKAIGAGIKTMHRRN